MSRELAELLDAVEVFIRRYVVVDEAQATAIALWLFHTHAIEAAHASPYLHAYSAEPESGKTRLLEVLAVLAHNPLLTMNISDAALFRAIHTRKPTLFFDEIDAIFSRKAQERGMKEDLRALLNAGYRRGQMVYRMGGGNHTQLESFNVFGAKALAGLGSLPSTLQSRCIQIELKRRRMTESIEDFFPDDVAEEADRLRDQIESWVSVMLETLRVARPDRVEGIRDRTMEVWRPLLAIADLDGKAWSARARRAVVSLSAGLDEDPSWGLVLLEDIRTVFGAKGDLRIPTTDLIFALARLEESPWSEWWIDSYTDMPNRTAARRLAQLLRPYGIRPHAIRVGDETPRGYRREDFLDAWERFLTGSRLSATSATPATSAPLSQAEVAGVALVAHGREGWMRDAEEAARVAYLAREAAAWEMLELDDDLLDRAAATIAVGVDPLVAVRNVAEEPQA